MGSERRNIYRTMRSPNQSPRSQYKESENRRISQSPTLAAKFAELEALKIKFSYRNPDGTKRNHEVKYTVNLEHVSSAFRIDCVSAECVGGDFDLTDLLKSAVAVRQRNVTGEMQCEGWLNRHAIDRLHCHQRLAFDFELKYRE